MTISLDHYFEAMRAAHDGNLPLNEDQQQALRHDYQSPLWIIAGPGTGKTHTLVWLTLKRILVDGIQPQRIFLTTFTRKAASELESRMIQARQLLADNGLEAAEQINLTDIHTGTLHSLASRILRDEHYEHTLHIRVLDDELTQQFFLRRTRNPLLDIDNLEFWQYFAMASENDNFPPNKAKRAENTCKLFNRLTENRINLDELEASGEEYLAQLVNAYRQYREDLTEKHRTDQAHLQQHFLNFLESTAGQHWLSEPLMVVVDEYQDTNPIQEKIYFTLAHQGDFTVVGDDDQSLYRFRGAAVESLINFDRACQHYLDAQPTQVYLSENRRSHPGIVEFFNSFIQSHPEMRDPDIRVRAEGKPDLVAAANVSGDYRPVHFMVAGQANPVAQNIASVISGLKANNLIEDYSQVAILTFSTRETNRGIGTYVDVLTETGIPVYNPRSKQAHKDARLKAVVGGLSTILDPVFDIERFEFSLPRGVAPYIEEAREAFTEACSNSPELTRYAEHSQTAVRQCPFDNDSDFNYLSRSGGRRVTLSGLFYKLLAHEPFASDLSDPEGGERIRVLNTILAEYESLFQDGQISLAQDFDDSSMIHDRWLYQFYSIFVEGIHDGLNDPENDETTLIPGRVNVMTIHQSKGLEFEVVFVLRPDKQPWYSDTHVLEEMLAAYSSTPTRPEQLRDGELRAAEDAIRLMFVAYSRAKRLLIIAGTLSNSGTNPTNTKWRRALGMAQDDTALTTPTSLGRLGYSTL